MKVSLIAALSRNGVIGTGDGGIPWDLPRDRDRFRSFTAGKHLLLGRVTYEEMEGWFSDHTPLVLTRDETFDAPVGRVVHRVEEAVTVTAEEGAAELCVCGGASVYEASLPYVDELVLTRVEADIEGTVKFPDFESGAEWETISEEFHPADDENSRPMTFLVLRRLHPSSLRPARMHWL